jgi:uncharacterized protein YndB with AHSA1/START domain
MTNRDEGGGTRAITVEAVLPHKPEAIWKTLTTAPLLAQWLMHNDFEPVIGKRFTFKTKPMGSWDGVVHCEVLEIVPNEKLVYSWKGGSDDNPKYGSSLNSTVIWTLTPVAGGTLLKLVHSGFRSPGNDFAFDAMSPGWNRVMARIDQITAGAAA